MHDPVPQLADRLAGALLQPEVNPILLVEELGRETSLDARTCRHLLRHTVDELNRKLFPPLHQMELLLAEGCNMACTYCFESAILAPGSGRRKIMPRETIDRALALLFDHAAPDKPLRIVLFGGEPMLNFEGIRHTVETTIRMGVEMGHEVSFDMTSNGLQMPDEQMQWLAEHGVKVLFSVDGLALNHDRCRLDKKGRPTFARVMDNIRRFRRYQPWIGVKMTVAPEAAADLYTDVRGLHAMGINQFVIGHATGMRWPRFRLREYLKSWSELHAWMERDKPENIRISDFEDKDDLQAPWFGCGAGRNTISVNVAGEVSGCSRLISAEPDRIIGHLGDVIHGLYRIRDRHEMISCGTLRDRCRAKGLENAYRGGCFSTNYEEAQDIYEPSRFEHELTEALRLIRAGEKMPNSVSQTCRECPTFGSPHQRPLMKHHLPVVTSLSPDG